MKLVGSLLVMAGLTNCVHADAPQPAHSASSSHALAGAKVPAFERAAIGGQRVQTTATGKILVVKFFASYCEPCVRTLPLVERIHEQNPDVVLIGIDEDDSESKARALIETYHLSFPVILDRDNILSGRFRVSSLPMMFVADREGVIRWVGAEDATDAELRAAILAAGR
jgi:thiol-disulfide isomerase/thioredoxin